MEKKIISRKGGGGGGDKRTLETLFLFSLLRGSDNCCALQLLLLSRYFTEGTHVRAYNLRKPLIMG